MTRSPDGVALVDVPAPIAGDGEVVVDVAYAGVCRTDLAAVDGALELAAGRVLGHELSGWLAGEPVTVIPFAGDRWLGIDRDGAFAERVCVPRACVLRLPRDLSLVLGAYVEPVAAALGVLGSIAPGDRVLVSGANRIAELTARVATAHGAAVDREVRGTYDVIVEHAGDAAALLPALRRGGTLLLKSRGHAPLALDAGALVARELTVRGVSHGSFHAAIDWLHGRRIVVDDLLAPPRPLADYAGVFADARRETHKQMFAIGARA